MMKTTPGQLLDLRVDLQCFGVVWQILEANVTVIKIKLKEADFYNRSVIQDIHQN